MQAKFLKWPVLTAFGRSWHKMVFLLIAKPVELRIFRSVLE